MKERIAAHEEARAGNLPDCTDEERWLRDDKFAVMKEKRVRAVRVFDSQRGSGDIRSRTEGRRQTQHRSPSRHSDALRTVL